MPTTTNPMAGLFQNVTQLSGSSQDVAKAQMVMGAVSTMAPEFLPYVKAIYGIVNALPAGTLKDWLSSNGIEFWKRVWTLIVGRKYTKGDYTLAERLNDQIFCNQDIGQTQATDQMVDIAHQIFNQLFGVRIATDEDLNALDFGVSAYKDRMVSQGISQDAIERAVFLKQHFYPIATYNKQCWDLRWFELYPLVDRIPDYELNKWYSGTVVGGGVAQDGLILVQAASLLKQIVGADFDPVTGSIKTSTGQVINPLGGSTGGSTSGGATSTNPLQRLISYVKTNPTQAAVIGAAVGYALYDLDED